MPEGTPLARPHFVVIGAMKCATSTLHDQLAAQPGVFMSDPKEPNFFSDDDVFARGLDWYSALFAGAAPTDLCGESSTHYTKLPTHPQAAERLHAHLPHARLVYVMRDPVERVVSQYVHEWSVRATTEPIDRAVRSLPRMIDYSRYATQVRPWLDRFGPDRVLPVFLERLTADPQPEFERIGAFLGLASRPVWDSGAGKANASADRMRRMRIEGLIQWKPIQTLRRTLMPEGLRDRLKSRWTLDQRPELSPEARAYCVERLDPDIRELGRLLATDLTCDTFRAAVKASPEPPDWAALPAPRPSRTAEVAR